MGKSDAGKIEEELVRIELMGSAEKGRFGRRITALWCCSRVAAAGKTAVLMGVLTLLASEASLVSLVRTWNAMVPPLEMATISENLDTNVTPLTVVSTLTTLLKQLTLKASKAPEVCGGDVGYDGFDGVDGGFDGFDGLGDINGVDGSGIGGRGGLEDLGDRSK